MRLFVPQKKTRLAYIIYLVILLNFLLYFPHFFAVMFACVPQEKIWKPSTPGHYLDLYLLLIFSRSCNIVSNFIMLVLPLQTIWHLQMRSGRKAQVSAVFGFGILYDHFDYNSRNGGLNANNLSACIASIFRVVEIFKAAQTKDGTYALFPLGLWTYVRSSNPKCHCKHSRFCRVGELATGIVCGCLPVTPPFFKHFVPIITSKLTSLSRKSSTTLGLSDQQGSPSSSWKRQKKYSDLAKERVDLGYEI